MGYLKKEYRIIAEKMDKELRLPKDWSRFVKKEAAKDSLIIKTQGICTCCNCKNEFKSKKKINEIEKCPKCKGEYLIKRNNYKWHTFTPRRVILLDKMEESWIIRLFEIHSWYVNGKIRHSDAIEYGRIVLSKDLHFVNNRLYCCSYGNEKVRTYEKMKSWRLYRNGYDKLNAEGKTYHNNLKELFKDNEYKYSQLWNLAKREKIDITYYLNNNLPSTELLIKMQLYKLALCPKTFNKQGNFEERFGIGKEYYEFMKKYNIDIDELDILRLYKKKDIAPIKYLRMYKIEHLKKIAKYMSMDKFIEFTKSTKEFDMHIYIDYIGFLEDLQLDLKNKKYLFPEDIRKEHDKYEKQVKIRKDSIVKRKIGERYEELQKNIFSNNKYFIVPAKSVNELEDESKQQNNCVRTYAERYSKGNCDIYFMREKENPKKSLVTVEVQKNKVVQSRIKNNRDINKIQKNFLDKWEDKVLNVA